MEKGVKVHTHIIVTPRGKRWGGSGGGETVAKEGGQNCCERLAEVTQEQKGVKGETKSW